jgi:hypothetical protein
MMGAPVLCARCHRSIDAGSALDGLCPACLLEMAVSANTVAPEETIASLGCRILSVLSVSASGTTYLADWPDGHARVRVVFKSLAREWPSADDTALHAIARQVAELTHPSIARMRAAGLTAARCPYVVFEYIAGLSLMRHCQRLALDHGARGALLDQLDEAIACAHRLGVTHGAIDASHVLVSSTRGSWTPVLLNLGVRHLIAGATEGHGEDDRARESHRAGSRGGAEEIARDLDDMARLRREVLE